jgi:membrane fusion protein, multidrug efflux system
LPRCRGDGLSADVSLSISGKLRTFLRRLIAVAIVAVSLVGFALVMTAPDPSKQTGVGGRSGGGMGGGGGQGRRLAAPQSSVPVPVLIAQARTADVPVYFEGVGTARALNLVTVRSQVDGKLISVNFHEGDNVRRGDVLARIDPATFQAQFDQATAKKALDEAQLANARRDLERYTNLVKANAVSQQQLDTTRSQVAQLEAQVRFDEAVIDNARALLDYCTITAPIDGRLGIRLVDEGNFVQASDPTGIVMLTQMRPMAVLFVLPQQQLQRVSTAFAAGALRAEATDFYRNRVLDRGKLQVIDNQIDQSTGTVQLKAEFPNQDLQLWPGQPVNVRLLIDTLRQVVVVPNSAVQRGPNGTFVYLIEPDDTVVVRSVTVMQQDESGAVVADGVKQSDRIVVTSLFGQLAEGRRVSIQGEVSEPSGATASSRGRGEGSGQARGGGARQRREGAASQAVGAGRGGTP